MQEQAIIDINSGTELQRKERSSPKFAMHCAAVLNNKIYITGGYYSRRYIYRISDADCNIDKLPIRLPLDMMRHSCALHQEKIWMCGSYNQPTNCHRYFY